MRIQYLIIFGCLIALSTPLLAQRNVRASTTSHHDSARSSTSRSHNHNKHHTSTKLVWVAGYDEVVYKDVWIPGRYEKHSYSTRICGVLVTKTRRVWVDGHFECRRHVIHHAGYYKEIPVKRSRHGHRHSHCHD